MAAVECRLAFGVCRRKNGVFHPEQDMPWCIGNFGSFSDGLHVTTAWVLHDAAILHVRSWCFLSRTVHLPGPSAIATATLQ